MYDRAVTTLPALNPEMLTRTSSGDQAALYIRGLIFDGVLKPGTRVPQDEIAQVLGISRIPLREALISLEREGWVRLEMHRGAFVTGLDERTVRDHYELFGLVYGYTVRQALARSGPELVEQLTKIEREFRDESDTIKAGATVVRFHATMIDAAKSNRIKVVLRAMSTVVPGDFFAHVPNAVPVERKFVPVILRAMRAGDAEKAATEYEKMMRRLGDEVVKIMRTRGLFDVAENGTE